MKENENDFAFIFFHFLAGNSLADCIRGLRPAPPSGRAWGLFLQFAVPVEIIHPAFV
jgi:hypothetical protein